MQYIPDNGLYVYFRYDKNETVMVVTNTNEKDIEFRSARYKERINGFSKMKDIITGKITELKDLPAAGKSSSVYELVK